MNQWTNLLEKLRMNEIVAYQSDTVPSIYARINSYDKLREVKKRDTNKPFILLLASLDMLEVFVSKSYSKEELEMIVNKFSGETVIFKVNELVDKNLKANDSIAIRIPLLTDLINVISKLEEPIFSTSVESKNSLIKEEDVIFLEGWNHKNKEEPSRIFSLLENKYIR